MYDRSKTIGASDAVSIAAGNWSELWDRKQATTPPEYALAARIGHATESMHRAWFTEQTKTPLIHSLVWDETPFQWRFEPWCTHVPDGLILKGNVHIPWEAKAVNMMWQPANLKAKYLPQLLHAMRVHEADHAILSVIYLNTKWEYYEIPYDPAADDELLRLERAFLWHLENGVRP
jgi:hypothetical protein